MRFATTGTLGGDKVVVTYLGSGSPTVVGRSRLRRHRLHAGDGRRDLRRHSVLRCPGITLTGIDGNELTFSGSGGNGVVVDPNLTPTAVGGGVYRYYLTGQFAAGTVRVQIVAGSWGDSAGDQGIGAVNSFRTIDQVQTQTSGRPGARDFFIELSGGM